MRFDALRRLGAAIRGDDVPAGAPSVDARPVPAGIPRQRDERARPGSRDPLTGLADRRRWETRLSAVCADARERGGLVSLLLFDLDHLRRVNDLHGSAAGDEVLRRVAGLLLPTVTAADLVARLGGDRFAVLLPGVPLARAVALADELRRAASCVAVDGLLPGEVGMSAGVAEAVGADAYPLELLSRADEQLYRAKITRNAVGARAPAP